MKNEIPEIGDVVNVRGVVCRVVVIRPLGTIDVREVDGSRTFRLSGLYRPGWPSKTVR